MSYEVFRRKVNALIDRAGGGVKVRFYNDADKGGFLQTARMAPPLSGVLRA